MLESGPPKFDEECAKIHVQESATCNGGSAFFVKNAACNGGSAFLENDFLWPKFIKMFQPAKDKVSRT